MSQFATCYQTEPRSICHAPQRSFPDDFPLTPSIFPSGVAACGEFQAPGETTMRNIRSFRMWTKSIALIVLSLGGLTQFGMAKWKSVAADTYAMVAPALPPPPAITASAEPRVAATTPVAASAAPTVSGVAIAAPASGAAPAP